MPKHRGQFYVLLQVEKWDYSTPNTGNWPLCWVSHIPAP